MEIKNLLTKFKQKEEEPEQFFALEIDNDSVKSAVWTVIDGQTKVVKIGTTQTWNGQESENLLQAVDQSISSASENLSQEPSGAIFGLPESWISKDTIQADKKKLLKTLCQQLELKPLGFVVTDTALIQYLKIQEGTPPSAIFLQVDSSELNLSLVKLGKIIGTELVGRSGDLGPDVEEGLSRFKDIDTLPSRMILYDGQTDFEEAKQQLTSYDWEEKLPFIHFPKVEILPPDTSIKAVSLAGGSEVAKSLGFDIKPPPPPAETPSSPSGHKPSPSVEPDESPDSEPSSQPDSLSQPLDTPSAASLGFLSDQDIAANLDSPPDSPLSPPQPLDTPPPLDSDVSQPSPFSPPDESPVSSPPKLSLNSLKSLPFSAFFSATSAFAKDKLQSLRSFFTSAKKTPRTLTLVAAGFVLLLTTLVLAYWRLPKAKITLIVEPKLVEEDLQLTIDPQADTLDPEAGILPGKSMDISVEGEKSASTTGTSTVGDPAAGSITIFNKTNSSKTFSSGSVLIGGDNLAFTLDEDTTVASRSSSEDDEGVITITPGKSQANITASSIGPEGNLGGGEKLAFKQFSEDDFSAKVDDGLSGGTAREVKAVSQTDQDNLLAALTEELKSQASQQLKQQLGADMSLVDVQDEDQLTSKNFNHDVDEEADTLNLSAKLEYTALAYRQADLDLLLQQSIKEKIPDDFQLSDTSETNIAPAQIQKNDQATIDVSFKAKLIPKLDFADLKSNLAGKYPHLIQEYLAAIPNFVKADIQITPKLPSKLKTLPRLAKNILIEVKTED